MSLPPTHNVDRLPFRLVVEAVEKTDRSTTVFGKVLCGTVRVGEELVFSPSNKRGVVRKIKVTPADSPIEQAQPGQSIALIVDGTMFIEPGETVSHEDGAPVETDVFKAALDINDGERLQAGDRLTLQLTGMACQVRIQSMEPSATGAGYDVILRTRRLIALDSYEELPELGQFSLQRDGSAVATGRVNLDGYPDQRELVTVRATNITSVEHDISGADRAVRNGHKSGVLWLTGLSGAGKSTLAIGLERRLFQMGYQTYVLDGDNVRHGLNANLGFSPDDRAENIRRVGEVAALFARAGFLVISAFISPYRSDRDRARAAAGEDFHEIHVATDLAVCERRDPKGLYKKARSGEIADFTGIDAPYEEPVTPELSIDTGDLTVDQAIDALVDYVSDRFTLVQT